MNATCPSCRKGSRLGMAHRCVSATGTYALPCGTEAPIEVVNWVLLTRDEAGVLHQLIVERPELGEPNA